MRVNANAVLHSWALLAAFGGSYAPVREVKASLRDVCGTLVYRVEK